MIDNLIRKFVILYIFFYVWVRRLGMPMRGLGYALRMLRKDFVFNVHDSKYWLNPECAGAYCIMPAGFWNEPETHEFLDRVLERTTFPVDFIDVGASVGEMVIPLSKNARVRNVTAFEPQPQCAKAIEKSVAINGLSNVTVVNSAVSAKSGFVEFSSSSRNPTAASVSNKGAAQDSVYRVECVALDDMFAAKNLSETIFLIDVEGHEPDILKGGIQTIKKAMPLIVFEYNQNSKKYFSLDDIRGILPSGYRFYRLRGDGFLDNDFRNSWNCAAVSVESMFYGICNDLIV